MNSKMKIFYKLTFFLLIFLQLNGHSAYGIELQYTTPETVGLSSERLSHLDRVMKEYIDEKKIPGAVVLIARHNKIAYLKSFGKMDDNDKPVESDAIFRIASMTKSVTIVALMMLFEEGRLLLSDPISKYIPEFKNLQVLEENPEGSEEPYKLVPAKSEITILQMLNQTSGITYRFWGHKHLAKIYHEANIVDGIAKTDETIGDMVKRLATLPLKHHPGTAWEYGLNADVIGYLIEVISGQKLDVFFKKRIVEKLSMTDTHFFLPEEKVQRLTAVYRPNQEKNSLSKIPPDEDVELWGNLAFSPSTCYKGPRNHFSGGAGLVSTIQDYAKLLLMLQNKGELSGVRLLSPKTINLMMRNHIGELTTMFGEGFGFSLGFLTHKDPLTSGSILSQNTYRWQGIYYTYFWVDPKEDMSWILLSQVIPNRHLDLHEKIEVLVTQAVVD